MKYWVYQSGHTISLLFGDPNGNMFDDSRSRELLIIQGHGKVREPNCSGGVSMALVSLANALNNCANGETNAGQRHENQPNDRDASGHHGQERRS